RALNACFYGWVTEGARGWSGPELGSRGKPRRQLRQVRYVGVDAAVIAADVAGLRAEADDVLLERAAAHDRYSGRGRVSGAAVGDRHPDVAKETDRRLRRRTVAASSRKHHAGGKHGAISIEFAVVGD